MSVHRRTFEAAQHPKGSAERARLNEDPRTSEYMTTSKWCAIGAHYRMSFRTKREAEAFEAAADRCAR